VGRITLIQKGPGDDTLTLKKKVWKKSADHLKEKILKLREKKGTAKGQ